MMQLGISLFLVFPYLPISYSCCPLIKNLFFLQFSIFIIIRPFPGFFSVYIVSFCSDFSVLMIINPVTGLQAICI